jgi:RNA polymerase sigma-70 factor (sigma-E family)
VAVSVEPVSIPDNGSRLLVDAVPRMIDKAAVVLGEDDLLDGTPTLLLVEQFDMFVVANSKSLKRTAFLIVGDSGAAEEIVQIALIKVNKKWASIAATGAALPYVRTAVVRTSITWQRRRWHGERASATLPELADSDAFKVVDTRDRLRHALTALPRRQRAAVVLRHYLDLDEAETAAVLGCSTGTVKSQTSKGLAKLRAALDSDSDEASN